MTVERYVVASEGLTLSGIVWNRYRASVPGAVEQALAINHHLASLPAELPLGTIVDIPVITTTSARKATVSLWD